MNKKIGLLLTSKNNYEMIPWWISKFDRGLFRIISIDEDSLPEKKELGKKICEQYNIEFYERDTPGMEFNILTAAEIFSNDSNIEWIFWLQHDCWPLTENFLQKINDLVTKNKFQDVGTIGFNGLNAYHGSGNLHNWNGDDTTLQITGRCPIEPGLNWYRPDNEILDYSQFNIERPYVIEIPCWFSVLVNIKLYKKYIIPDSKFRFFHSWDDIAMQFLNKNIYNICIPWLTVGHDQHQKIESKTGIQISSARQTENQKINYGGDHQQTRVDWMDKWKFPYDSITPIREYTSELQNLYDHTLIGDFFKHTPANGPLKYYDVIR